MAKASVAALALEANRDAFISTAPIAGAGNLAAIVGSALSSEEKNQEETFFDQIHRLWNWDC